MPERYFIWIVYLHKQEFNYKNYFQRITQTLSRGVNAGFMPFHLVQKVHYSGRVQGVSNVKCSHKVQLNLA